MLPSASISTNRIAGPVVLVFDVKPFCSVPYPPDSLVGLPHVSLIPVIVRCLLISAMVFYEAMNIDPFGTGRAIVSLSGCRMRPGRATVLRIAGGYEGRMKGRLRLRKTGAHIGFLTIGV
jgi:hypothetical protein